MEVEYFLDSGVRKLSSSPDFAIYLDMLLVFITLILMVVNSLLRKDMSDAE